MCSIIPLSLNGICAGDREEAGALWILKEVPDTID
jgi:hypothetical protein